MYWLVGRFVGWLAQSVVRSFSVHLFVHFHENFELHLSRFPRLRRSLASDGTHGRSVHWRLLLFLFHFAGKYAQMGNTFESF